MKNTSISLTATIILTVVLGLGFSAKKAYAQAPTNLGLVGVKSVYGKYLQGHQDNGELHASNHDINQEETWFLIQIDEPNHIYTLQNWSNGRYLSQINGDCARSNSTVIGPSQEWRMLSGKPWGIINSVIFVNVASNKVLAANDEGNNSSVGCGGEVESTAGWSGNNPAGGGDPAAYRGWWVMVPANPPSRGNDPWTLIDGTFQGILNKISPADIGAAIAAVGG